MPLLIMFLGIRVIDIIFSFPGVIVDFNVGSWNAGLQEDAAAAVLAAEEVFSFFAAADAFVDVPFCISETFAVLGVEFEDLGRRSGDCHGLA